MTRSVCNNHAKHPQTAEMGSAVTAAVSMLIAGIILGGPTMSRYMFISLFILFLSASARIVCYMLMVGVNVVLICVAAIMVASHL